MACTVSSGDICSGQVGSTHLADNSVKSNHVASGQLEGAYGTKFHLAQGTVGGSDIAGESIFAYHFNSGIQPVVCPSFQAQVAESVSGLRAVCLTSLGKVALADAYNGAKLPVVGVVSDNLASGDVATVVLGGGVKANNSTIVGNWSGQVGKTLYVGAGGSIVAASLLISGAGFQRLGVAFSGGLVVSIDRQITSGLVSSPVGTV